MDSQITRNMHIKLSSSDVTDVSILRVKRQVFQVLVSITHFSHSTGRHRKVADQPPPYSLFSTKFSIFVNLHILH